MPDTIDASILESVSIANVKAVAELPANLSNLSYMDARLQQQIGANDALFAARIANLDTLDHRRRANILAELTLANTIKGVGQDINEKTAADARADVNETTGDEGAKHMVDIAAADSFNAQLTTRLDTLTALLVKLVQTSVPETTKT